MPILDPRYETMKQADLQQLQLERLQAMLNRVMRNVPFYQSFFKQSNLLPTDFRTLSDITKLPLLDRAMLVKNHPYGMFAVPLREVVRLHPSHTRRTEPIVIGHTKYDIQVWTHLKARSFAGADVTQNDLVQVYLEYTFFPGAVVAHYGAEELGACVTPLYNMPIAEQIKIMRNYHTTVLICTPTRAIHIVRYMKENGMDPKSMFLRAILFVGESWSQDIRKQVEEELFVEVYGNYGVSEICIPGIAFECGCRNGMHLCEDHFLFEIIDPDTGLVLQPGERGELVISTLTREAFPLLRFRTGDFTSITNEPCSCGRTFRRMENVKRRTDDILRIEGVTFVPSEIGMILNQIEHVKSGYCIILKREGSRDRLEIEVEITPEIFVDHVRALERMRQKIEDDVFELLNIQPIVKLVEPKTLAGKEQVIDLRE